MNWKSNLYLYKQILEFQKEHDLRFGIKNPRRIMSKLGIEWIHYQGLEALELLKVSKDGFTVHQDGNYYIFYNPDMMERRQNFTFSHELGHIILGHHTIAGTEILHTKDYGLLEYQANTFARNILMPPKITLEQAEHNDEYELGDKFLVNSAMVKVRLNYLKRDIYWTKEVVRRGLFKMD